MRRVLFIDFVLSGGASAAWACFMPPQLKKKSNNQNFWTINLWTIGRHNKLDLNITKLKCTKARREALEKAACTRATFGEAQTFPTFFSRFRDKLIIIETWVFDKITEISISEENFVSMACLSSLRERSCTFAGSLWARTTDVLCEQHELV